MKYALIITGICLSLQGCVVFAAADLAATAVVKTAGLVVDGTVGAVKMVGNAVSGGDKDEKKDGKK